MTESRPVLTVVRGSEAFSELWPELAERHDLELRLADAPEPVRESRSAAVVLHCAGRETEALELLHEAHRAGIGEPLVVGAEADHRLAVELMRRGAAGYYALPPDAERLEQDLVDRADRLGSADRSSEPARTDGFAFEDIVGEDPSLREALDRAASVIPRGSATVLIEGETGTGKELLAHAVHDQGPRAREPFVPVNCSAIPSNLLESELFGHETGAFTDARAAKPGLFQVADGGTLFLDEVATLPLELQAKLLRVLESGEIRRVGGVQATRVDVRVVAAANADLRRRVAEGEFREDLYYRLAVFPIHLPPLRERGRDVLRLARHFLVELADEYEMSPPELTDGAVRALERHRWPGNVRELRNAVERALLLCRGAAIREEHLALEEAAVDGGRPGGGEADGLPFPTTLEELEVAATRRMIQLCEGNKSEAARRLGIPRSRLYRILDREEGQEDG